MLADNFFCVQQDDRGTLHPRIPPHLEGEFAQEIKDSEWRGVSLPVALLIIEDRLSAVESIPRVTEVGSSGARVSAGQAPKPIKRMGRLDRCRFGYRPDPRNNAKLLPDKEEQQTIHRAQLLRSFKLSLREVCRRLDQEGRGRRGKKWEGAHSVLGDILARNKSV